MGVYMKNAVIVGVSDAADVIYSYLRLDPNWNVIGFVIERDYIKEPIKFDLPVVSFEEAKDKFKVDYCAVMGVGYSDVNGLRERLYNETQKHGMVVEKYIHPDACIYTDESLIGEGAIVLPGVIVEPYAKIGKNCVIWSGSIIGHHAKVEDNCWISAGSVLSGHSSIGVNGFMGVNSVVSNGVSLGERNVVGANGSVFKDTSDDEVYISGQSEKYRFKSNDFMKHFMR